MAMTLRTGFIGPATGRLPGLLAVLGLLALLSLGGLWWQLADARRAAAEHEAASIALASLRESQAEAGEHPAGWREQEAAGLLEKIRAINALSQVQGPPATRVLELLEAHLPEQAYLLSLHHRQRTGEVHLVAEAPGPEPLSAFLRALEAEPSVAQAMLVRQGREPRDGRPAVQFEIRLRTAGNG